MITLSTIHILYLIATLVIIIVMAFKKDIVVPCMLGILAVSLCWTGSIPGALQGLFNSLIWAGNEFWSVIIVISIVVAMSKALSALGADALLIRPFARWLVNPTATFFSLGFVMLIISWFIWPSPAVALVGALMVPAAIKAGVPAIWAAVALNLFGHGVALSGDFFIQGAPTITAKAAGSDVGFFMSKSFPLWLIMSVVTIVTAYLFFRRDLKRRPRLVPEAPLGEAQFNLKPGARPVAILTALTFLADIVLMLVMNLQGGDATALVGGSALVVLVVASLVAHGPIRSLEQSTEYIKQGLGFGIRIFAPVIVIGAFFFLGDEAGARAVFGDQAPGIFNDVGQFLAQRATLSKAPVILSEAAISAITGLDGSGFSGMSLMGSTAATFAGALPIQKETLAAMGQIITIWVGGGTLIPWAVIPVAAICGVKPEELVHKNLPIVLTGLTALVVATFFLL
jgi:hypothetical protein